MTSKPMSKRAILELLRSKQVPIVGGITLSEAQYRDLYHWVSLQLTPDERIKENHRYMVTGAAMMFAGIVLMLAVAMGFGLGAFL